MLNNPKDLDLLVDRIGDSQFVLLGEASHGTSEFYKWRSEISKRLILEKGFSFIAVEGDWPDCFKVNGYIKSYYESSKNAYDVLHSFNRWPTWMWANKEMVELVEWLKEYNDTIINQQKLSTTIDKTIGFYGLDLYSLWESMEAIIEYLKKKEPSLLKQAIDAYNCFEPYNKDVEAYARATAFVPENCEEEVIEILTSLKGKHGTIEKTTVGDLNKEEYFNAEQNAIVAKDAEQYYRTMMKGDANSWNLRDTHMMDTLERLMDFYSQNDNNSKSKAIIWAHNTHIGDARFTDMAQEGMINIGQLVRQKKGIDNTVLIGFSTYSGTVIAAEQWGSKMEIMNVPPAREGSWDNLLHNMINDNNNLNNNKVIIFKRDDSALDTDTKTLSKEKDSIHDEYYKSNSSRGQRAIGVVYNPKYERFGNYVPTHLTKRYDALIFIDKTNALSPLHMKTIKNKDLPETYPTGV